MRTPARTSARTSASLLAILLASAGSALPVLAPTPAAALPGAPCAFAADPPAAEVKDAPADEAKSALAKFETGFGSKFTTDRMKALQALQKVRHPTVAARLTEVLKDADEAVRTAAATALGGQTTPSCAPKAAAALLRVMDDEDEKPKVRAAAVAALGPLQWKKAAKDVEKLIWNEEDDLVCAAFSAFGAWKDASALREMYEFFDMYPDEKSFQTGSISVDTGAEGNKDANAAKAKWKAKYGAARSWRPRPECSRALRTSLQQITGFGFRRPEDLKLYLDDPKKYPDPEKVAERVEEPKRRTVHDAYRAAEKEATAIGKKEFPGDAPNDERAKLIGRELRKLRADLIEKHGLRLSELDVILEEGKAKGW